MSIFGALRRGIEQHKAEVATKQSALREFALESNLGTPLEDVVEFELTGINHAHDGCYPQALLKKRLIGLDVELKPEPKNKHDNYAIKVLCEGKYIGWLPASEVRQKQKILRRIERGIIIPSRVVDVYVTSIGEPTGKTDEDGWKIYETRYLKTAKVAVAIYALPKQRAKSK